MEKDEQLFKDEVILSKLVELVAHSLELTEEEQDPLQHYISIIKNRFYSRNPSAFQARFQKGYRTLLSEVNKSD